MIFLSSEALILASLIILMETQFKENLTKKSMTFKIEKYQEKKKKIKKQAMIQYNMIPNYLLLENQTSMKGMKK